DGSAEVYPGSLWIDAVPFGRKHGCRWQLHCGRAGEATVADAARAHDLFGEAVDGPRTSGRSGRAQTLSVPHRSGKQERDSSEAWRKDSHAAGNFRVYPARVE